MNRKVLLTSSGAKFNLIGALKESLKHIGREAELILGDSNPTARSILLFPDISIVTPKWDQQDGGSLLEFLGENSVEIVVPSSDRDVNFFSKNKRLLQLHGIYVMTPDNLDVSNVLDKLKFYEEFGDIFPIITTKIDVEGLDCETFVVKERFGYGSIGAKTQLSKHKAVAYANSLSAPIFQPYIYGTEYTVDVYISPKYGILGSIIRERVEVRDGESKLAKVISNRHDIKEMAEEFAKKSKMLGHINVQIIESSRELNIVECNPRVGGGSSISMKCGLNSLPWFILECHGIDPIKKLPFVELKPSGFFVRFEQETYVDVRI